MGAKKYVDETVFDVWTDESEYWLGFLMGDGNMGDSPSVKKRGKQDNSIALEVARVDDTHIEKFAAFMGSEHKITRGVKKHGGKPYTKLEFASRPLRKKLAHYGVVPRKSKREELINKDPTAAFFRGIGEADGSISDPSSRYRYRLYSSKVMCEAFKDWLVGQGVPCGHTAVLVDTPSKDPSEPDLFCFGVHGGNALATVELLYTGATVYLDRKYEIAKQYLEELSRRRELLQLQPAAPDSSTALKA